MAHLDDLPTIECSLDGVVLGGDRTLPERARLVVRPVLVGGDGSERLRLEPGRWTIEAVEEEPGAVVLILAMAS